MQCVRRDIIYFALHFIKFSTRQSCKNDRRLPPSQSYRKTPSTSVTPSWTLPTQLAPTNAAHRSISAHGTHIRTAPLGTTETSRATFSRRPTSCGTSTRCTSPTCLRARCPPKAPQGRPHGTAGFCSKVPESTRGGYGGTRCPA